MSKRTTPRIVDEPPVEGMPPEFSITANRIDMASRRIIIYDAITELLARDISTYLPILDSIRDEPIKVLINSPGGTVYDTQTIITEFERCENKIIMDITGVAFSGAAMLALAGDEVQISKYGLYMLHYPNWETELLSLGEHQKDVNVMKEYFERMMKELLKRTKMSLSKFKELSASKDAFLTPKQCIKWGIADKIY